MNLTMLSADYRYSLGADEPSDEAKPTGKAVDVSKAPSALQGWVNLIATQGLEYYRVYKGTQATQAEANQMSQAFEWMVSNGYLSKPGGSASVNYTPWIVGGVVVLAALAAGGVLVSKRRRR